MAYKWPLFCWYLEVILDSRWADWGAGCRLYRCCSIEYTKPNVNQTDQFSRTEAKSVSGFPHYLWRKTCHRTIVHSSIRIRMYFVFAYKLRTKYRFVFSVDILKSFWIPDGPIEDQVVDWTGAAPMSSIRSSCSNSSEQKLYQLIHFRISALSVKKKVSSFTHLLK